jgi:predicted O-methyltransferase YrrM
LIALTAGGLDESSDRKNLRIMEIGFNAGHSADLFLKNINSRLISFDINDHKYVEVAKKCIDFLYPGRHLLITGDSRQSVPKFMEVYPEEAHFDVIFIDGGHDYDIAKSDLDNCLKMASENTLIIMDDIVTGQQYQWTEGPSKVWEEAVASKQIKEIGKSDYYAGRGMRWGKKIFIRVDV